MVKQNSGQTFLVYVEKHRLAYAYELLAVRHSIKESANICGFSNASSFSRAFKRSCGFSPSLDSIDLFRLVFYKIFLLI
ncbi:MAG: AraC family transcriptional regulator [Treponema sp.]|nr:AraC family transcriptional regulator [Treponema sp.]